jgi:carbonic anhydrase/acetyltransferase-like protein (isoleucine patch superfamily)
LATGVTNRLPLVGNKKLMGFKNPNSMGKERLNLMNQFSFDGAAPSIDQSAFVAPNATVIGRVSIGKESSIWFNCVVRGDINSISIGNHTNVQDGSLLHVTHRHPLTIRDRVTVGHGVILHGCEIANDCLIAMGAIVLDGAVVGEGALIGAGSLVPPGMQVPANSLVMGVPGKVVRELTPQDRDRVMRGWKNYVGYAQSYRKQLAEQMSGEA